MVILSWVCAALLLLSVLLGERVQLSFAGGSLSPFAVAFVIAAAVLWLRDGITEKPYRAVGLNTVAPLLTLLIVLPIAGLAVGTTSVPQMYTLLVPATILAVLSLARAKRLHGLRLDLVGYLAILAHGLYGLGQTLYRLEIVPASLWAPMVAWDMESQLSLNDAYLVVGRSTGLFVNANSFGLWSCLAIVFAVVTLRGRHRGVGIVLGVSGVLGSQSRTALLILMVLLLIAGVRALRDSKLASRIVAGAGGVAVVSAFAASMGWLPRLIEIDLVDRLVSGVGVISGGAAADANLAGRVSSWQEAWEFSASFPFGTFGPPQAHFGRLIDNEFVYLYLQGGVLLVLAYIVALASPAVLRRRGVPGATNLWVVSAVMFIASFTMVPLQAVGAAMLGWLAGAAAMGASDPDCRPDLGTSTLQHPSPQARSVRRLAADDPPRAAQWGVPN